MTWLFVIVVILVIGAGVLLAAGRLGGGLPPVEQDLRPDRRDGEPSFDVVVRGYRMDEVDAQLAHMQAEIDRLRGHAADAGE